MNEMPSNRDFWVSQPGCRKYGQGKYNTDYSDILHQHKILHG